MSDNANKVNITHDLHCSILKVEQALSNLKETISAWPDSPFIYSELYKMNMVRHLEDMLSYLDLSPCLSRSFKTLVHDVGNKIPFLLIQCFRHSLWNSVANTFFLENGGMTNTLYLDICYEILWWTPILEYSVIVWLILHALVLATKLLSKHPFMMFFEADRNKILFLSIWCFNRRSLCNSVANTYFGSVTNIMHLPVLKIHGD